jgi:transcription initiation factor IIE alpha subunit
MRVIKAANTHKQVAKIMAELVRAQGTRIEISERTGLHRNFVSRIIAALREEKCVYVIDWKADTTGRYQQEIFTLGMGEDKPRRPRQTQRERDAKRYRKMKERKQAEMAVPIRTSFVGGSLWA